MLIEHYASLDDSLFCAKPLLRREHDTARGATDSSLLPYADSLRQDDGRVTRPPLDRLVVSQRDRPGCSAARSG
jgi:hypothetical protein